MRLASYTQQQGRKKSLCSIYSYVCVYGVCCVLVHLQYASHSISPTDCMSVYVSESVCVVFACCKLQTKVYLFIYIFLADRLNRKRRKREGKTGQAAFLGISV